VTVQIRPAATGTGTAVKRIVHQVTTAAAAAARWLLPGEAARAPRSSTATITNASSARRVEGWGA
jgi:hypothetical protein